MRCAGFSKKGAQSAENTPPFGLSLSKPFLLHFGLAEEALRQAQGERGVVDDARLIAATAAATDTSLPRSPPAALPRSAVAA